MTSLPCTTVCHNYNRTIRFYKEGFIATKIKCTYWKSGSWNNWHWSRNVTQHNAKIYIKVEEYFPKSC